MTNNDDFSISLQDLQRVLYRHRKKSLIVFSAIMGVIFVALMMWPRTYQSDGKLFVRVGRESVTLDPTATTGQNITVYESRENEINSVIEMLRSRAMAEKVVEALGPEFVLGQTEDDKPSIVGKIVGIPVGLLKSVLEPAGDISLRERALIEFEGSLQVYQPEKSNMITVAYRADAPELAQKVVAALLDKYVDEHVRLHQTEGSYDFFVEQEEMFRIELATTSNELRDAKNGMKVVSIHARRSQLEKKVTEIASGLRTSEADLSTGRARINSLQGSLAELPERIVTEEVTGVTNFALDGMRERLYELEMQEKEMLSKYQPAHPLVIALRNQVEAAREVYAKQNTPRVEKKYAINPEFQAEKLKLLTELTHVKSLEAGIEALGAQYAVTLDELKTLNKQEVQIAQLQRDVDIAETNYKTYAQKLEEARIQHALESERISNINIAQAATLMEKPVSPNKALILALGFVIASIGACGVGFLAEQLDTSLKSREHIERTLEMPVLLSIPRVSAHNINLN